MVVGICLRNSAFSDKSLSCIAVFFNKVSSWLAEMIAKARVRALTVSVKDTTFCDSSATCDGVRRHVKHAKTPGTNSSVSEMHFSSKGATIRLHGVRRMVRLGAGAQ